jgi:uncharacterized protein YegP (UPF0339 family)
MNTLDVYKDRKREWRWRLIAENGRKVACCGEGYRRRKDCLDEAHTVLKGAYRTVIAGVLQ